MPRPPWELQIEDILGAGATGESEIQMAAPPFGSIIPAPERIDVRGDVVFVDTDLVTTNFARLVGTPTRITYLTGVVAAGSEERIQELEVEVKALKIRVEQLEASAEEAQEEDVVVIRTVERDQAKDEIRTLFQSGEILFMSEVAERLNLPDELVVELCMELREEGEIQVNDQV